MISYLKKARYIAKSGLTTIGEIKSGEFSLHCIFFERLKTVNPKIRDLEKVADIITLQAQVIKNYRASFKQIKISGQFSNAEIQYISNVFSKMLDDTANNLEELFKVLTANEYQMTDDQRIKHIELLYEEMQSNYQFTQHFSKETLVLAVQRLKEKNEVQQSRDWYDIK